MPTLRTPKSISSKPPWHWYDSATLFALLILFVVLFSGGFLLLKPRYESILLLKAEIARAKEEQRVKTNILEVLGRLIENAKTLTAEQRAYLAYMLPPHPDLPGLFVQVEQLTQASGMGLKSMSIEEKGTKTSGTPSAVLSLPFVITYDVPQKNPYTVLKQSLVAFEQNLRLLDLESFAFEPKKESEQAGETGAPEQRRQMQMKFSTYYLPEAGK